MLGVCRSSSVSRYYDHLLPTLRETVNVFSRALVCQNNIGLVSAVCVIGRVSKHGLIPVSFRRVQFPTSLVCEKGPCIEHRISIYSRISIIILTNNSVRIWYLNKLNEMVPIVNHCFEDVSQKMRFTMSPKTFSVWYNRKESGLSICKNEFIYTCYTELIAIIRKLVISK